MPTDSELLTRYVGSRDEAAFQALVERYLPLVRGVLWRRMGDVDQVDELAMQTFAALAQNAGDLCRRASVGGWLVITARQKSAESHRKAATRSRHMKKLAEHETARAAGVVNQASALDEAKPHLDDALASLAEHDRDAVLLHFYDGLPYREIGQRIARGEDAARKRVNKALERMAAFLKRRGVTLTGTVLAGGLGAQLTSTVQGASATSISTGALALAGNSVAPTAIATASLAKWALAGAAVLLVSGGVGFVTAKRADPPPAISSNPKETKAGPVTALDRPSASYQTLSPEIAARLRDPVPERLQLAVDLWDERSKRASAIYEYGRVMASFTPDECAEAIDLMDRDHTYNRNRHWRMCREFLRTLLKADFEAGAEYVAGRSRAGDAHWKADKRIWEVVDTWGEADPAAARAWLDQQELPDPLRHQLVDNLIGSTSRRDPATAIELLLELPPDARHRSRGSIASMDEAGLETAMLDATAAIADETERALLFESAILRRLKTPEEIFDAYAHMRFSRGDAVVPLIDEMLYGRAEKQPETLPEVFGFALDNAPEAAHPFLLKRYAQEWIKAQPDIANEWLADNGITPDDIADAVASFERR